MDVINHIEQERKHELGHRVGGIGGNVGHDDAPLAGGLNVHIVVSGGQDTYIFKFGQFSEHISRHEHLIGQHTCGICRALHYLVRCGAVIDGHFAELVKGFPRQVTAVGHIAVKYNDFFHDSRECKV